MEYWKIGILESPASTIPVFHHSIVPLFQLYLASILLEQSHWNSLWQIKLWVWQSSQCWLSFRAASVSCERFIGSDAGSDLLGQGLLILPMIGLVAFARGALVLGIALLYVVFAVGMFASKDWARPLGIALAVVNLLLVLSVLIQGESLARAVFWIIVPVIILWRLLSPTEDPTLNVSPKAK